MGADQWLDGATGDVLLELMFDPIGEIDPQATAVHGIRHEDVIGCCRFGELYDDLVSVIGGKVVVAHNASFDKRALKHTCEVHGLPMIDAEWVCSMPILGAATGNGRRVSLARAADALGINFPTRHDATADAVALWKMLQKVV